MPTDFKNFRRDEVLLIVQKEFDDKLQYQNPRRFYAMISLIGFP